MRINLQQQEAIEFARQKVMEAEMMSHAEARHKVLLLMQATKLVNDKKAIATLANLINFSKRDSTTAFDSADSEEGKMEEHSDSEQSRYDSGPEDKQSVAMMPSTPIRSGILANKSTSNKQPKQLGFSLQVIEHFIYCLILFGVDKASKLGNGSYGTCFIGFTPS